MLLPEYHCEALIYLTFKHRYAISAFTSNAFTVADVREFLKLQLVSPEHYGPTALKIRKKRKKKKKKKKKKKSGGKTKKKQFTSRSREEEDDVARRDAERQRREEMMAQEMEFVPQAAEDVLDEEEWRDIFEDETCEDDYEEDNDDDEFDDDEFDDVIEL